MQYRQIGKTGMSASVIGLGAEHLDNKPYEIVKETVHAALDHDVNIIDIFMPGDEIRQNIGKALAGQRDKVMIQGHIGSVDLTQQYDISRDLATCQRYFENLLRCLNTDYIDFGMMFNIDDLTECKTLFASDIYEYAQKLKQKGVIRAIGASCHNTTTGKYMVENGLVDMLMFSVNPVFDMLPPDTELMDVMENKGPTLNGIDANRLDLYRLCEQRQVGITAMKTLFAGKLLSADLTPFAKPLTVGQCIHYALTRPAVVSTLVGCESGKHVKMAVEYLNMSETELDYTDILKTFSGAMQSNCVYCNHCQPCPSKIDIAAVNKYLDIAQIDLRKIPEQIKQAYQQLKYKASLCIKCEQCESRCPFGVPVVEKMTAATQTFE